MLHRLRRHEVDRRASAAAADDRHVIDQLRRVRPGAVERMAVHPGRRRPRVAHLQDHATVEWKPDEVLEAARVVGLPRDEKPLRADDHGAFWI
jgi:hypothetical protein